jgi:acid phosphatase class B
MNYGVPVHELMSEESIHFASFAAVSLSRERFQPIAQNITFDDMSNFKNFNLFFTSIKRCFYTNETF